MKRIGAEAGDDLVQLIRAESELATRRAAWQAPAPHYAGGVWAKYAALVSSASDGAITTGVRLAKALKGSTDR